MSIDPATLPGVVLDDSQAELTGTWDRSSSFKPHVGRGYLHDNRRGDGQSTAVFRVKLSKTGRYDVRMAYSPHATRATKVPVIIKSGGAETRLTVDETQPLDPGGAFRSVGQVDLTGDGTQETTITISNTQTEGFVILDAIQLLEASKK
ncbi:hypothetical protein [Verrucomicrobium spinosum]|uniref:golvesin C-terminal-like domain-containing protein n=1 Tax=Verrucomicrobium spinosum TaxID=2736 RepID=UPI001C440984|nr:hypothetical protein [Verrucomicrobium spinosum]